METSWLGQALLPFLQVRICFANCVPCSNSQFNPHLTAPTTWLPAGSFSSHHSQAEVGTPLLLLQPALATRGQQGSVHQPGTHGRLSSARKRAEPVSAQERRNGSEAPDCPVHFPLLPVRKQKGEENGGRGGRNAEERGGRMKEGEKERGSPFPISSCHPQICLLSSSWGGLLVPLCPTDWPSTCGPSASRSSTWS